MLVADGLHLLLLLGNRLSWEAVKGSASWSSGSCRSNYHDWVAVKELELSYYDGEALLFTIYIYPLW